MRNRKIGRNFSISERYRQSISDSATSNNEAIKIAKDNPEFEYLPSASIEVRPIKTKEVETGFVYPTK